MKKIIIVLVLVALALGAYVYISSDQESKESAEYSTYTNDEYGFSFNYPKDWELKESSGDSEAVVHINKPLALHNPDGINMIPGEAWISVYYYSSLDELQNHGLNVTADFKDKENVESLEELLSDDSVTQMIGKTTIGGHEAFETILGGYAAYYTVYTMTDSGIYKIYYNYTDNKEGLSSDETMIISTFEFVE